MNSKTTEFLAEGIARMVRQHVTERLGPFQGRQDALISIVNEQRGEEEKLQQRIDMLESSVAELQRTLQLRRVA